MKKVGGKRLVSTPVRSTLKTSREPWRMWVLTLTGLGFALLVITLLMQKNGQLQDRILLLERNAENGQLIFDELRNEILESSSAQAMPVGGGMPDECGENAGECLMYVNGAYFPQGLGVVEGYYEAYETTDWDGSPVICDAFVITDGSVSLLEGFGKLADSGSGFVPRVSDGKFLAKIDFADVVANMTNEEITAVKSSTEDDQAELQVFVYQSMEGGAGKCQSPFAVLEVE